MRQLVMGYDELKLRIDRRDAGSYHVFASTPSAEASTEFELPFGEHEVENFILKVSRPRGRRRIEASAIGEARQFGGRLFTSLFHRGILSLYRDALSEARGQGRGVRVTLCLTESPELIDVPWEYLFDDPDFLAVSAFTPVVRYLDLPRGHRPLVVEPPLRLLGVVSSPADYEQLDVERERSNLEGALSDLSATGAIELHWLEQPTLGGLLRALQSQTFHALHYIGHGAYDRDAETGVLLFEDDAGWSRPVSGDKLGMIVHDFSSLRLAVLNACEGARTARSDPFAGVAGSLVRRDIPAVVAMQFEISDEAAIVFAGGFYRPLAAGAPVDTSVAAARLAMLAERSDDIEWGTPVLFMRVSDGQLFDFGDQPGLSDVPEVEEADPATGPAATDDVPVAAASAGAGVASASPARGNGATAPGAGRSAAAELTRTRGRRRGRRRLLVAGAVAGVLVIVAVIAALIPGSSPAAHNTLTASAPPFKIKYRKPWRSQALSTLIGLVSGHVTLTAGQLASSAPVPGGPPPDVVDRYGHPDASVNAQVAGHPGREYTWLSSHGEVVAYVLPTAVGDGVIICKGPASAVLTLQSCGELATRAEAPGATILPPGPDRALALKIAPALKEVKAVRSTAQSLHGALSTRRQTTRNVYLTEAHATAALMKLSPPPRYREAVERVTKALSQEAAGFFALAKAADSNDPAAYSGALGLVSRGSRALDDATVGIRSYHFGVPQLDVLHLTGPPPIQQKITANPPAGGHRTPPNSPVTTTTTTTTPPVYTQPQPTYVPPQTTVQTFNESPPSTTTSPTQRTP